MTTAEKTKITIETTIEAPAEKVWKFWTTPAHIIKWNCPSPEWHTPKAEHELKAGGKFNFRMEARDGSMGFDFGGVYDKVDVNRQLDYTIGDGRTVKINFSQAGKQTKIVQTFEAESENPVEFQRAGWQGILNNFKKYTEEN